MGVGGGGRRSVRAERGVEEGGAAAHERVGRRADRVECGRGVCRGSCTREKARWRHHTTGGRRTAADEQRAARVRAGARARASPGKFRSMCWLVRVVTTCGASPSRDSARSRFGRCVVASSWPPTQRKWPPSNAPARSRQCASCAPLLRARSAFVALECPLLSATDATVQVAGFCAHARTVQITQHKTAYASTCHNVAALRGTMRAALRAAVKVRDVTASGTGHWRRAHR